MKKTLHILFLCGWYPSEVSPTNGDFIKRHAEAVNSIHKVTVVHLVSHQYLQSNHRIDRTIDNGIETYIGYVKPSKNLFVKYARFWNVYIQIFKKIGTFDVLHLNEIYPFGLAALHLNYFRKIPYIISEHWTGYHFPKSQNISFLQKYISKKIVKNASFVCPVSSNLKHSMENFGLHGTYKTVPNVVDTLLFKPKEKTENHFTIVHVSSLLDSHKNIRGMLRVAKKLEESIGTFTWNFIGGSAEQYLKDIEVLKFKKASIQFIHHIAHEQLVGELQKASVFVLFSNYENLPCVILESFSCGTPVVSSNVGGISEYFPAKFGTLISKGDEKELFNSLRLFHQEKKQLTVEMHTYAHQHFSKNTIANSFSELYYESLKT